MGQQWQEGACLYFSFDQKWRKYGILVLLGPKNAESEKNALIAQVLAFKSLIYIKTSYYVTA